MHSEFYVVEEDQAELINETRKNGGRIISVGTTSCRTLESAADENGNLQADVYKRQMLSWLTSAAFCETCHTKGHML